MYLPHDEPPVWDSGLATVTVPLEIALPPAALRLLQDLASALQSEFALFLSAAWQHGRLVVSDWFCPRQAVTRNSVRILEEPPPGYSGVLHAHPPGCRAFSAVDRTCLNPNFAFSVLYLPPAEFPAAAVHIPLPDGGRAELPARAQVVPLDLDCAMAKIRREGGESRAVKG